MLGFGDGWVAAAYFFSILSAVLCIIYGIIYWNKEADDTDAETKQWMKEEIEIEKNL